MKFFSNGCGQTTGDQLSSTKPIYSTGNAWYVNSVGGVDAAGTAGQDEQKPLATIGQACANASAGDTIILMDGHTETLTVSLTIAKQLYIVGGGATAGIPTVSFTMNAAVQDTFVVTAAHTEIRGVRFKASAVMNDGGTYGAKVVINAVTGCRIIGCYFDMGANDRAVSGVYLVAASHDTRIENCTFVSTATGVTNRPESAIRGSTVSDLELSGVVLSDGSYGYQNPAFNYAALVITRLRGANVSLLLGAEMVLNASTTGWIATPTVTKGGRISW